VCGRPESLPLDVGAAGIVRTGWPESAEYTAGCNPVQNSGKVLFGWTDNDERDERLFFHPMGVALKSLKLDLKGTKNEAGISRWPSGSF
jgi:hypothetical protein